MAKRILRHTLLGLDLLVRYGIVHGDYNLVNLLFPAQDLGAMYEADLSHSRASLRKTSHKTSGAGSKRGHDFDSAHSEIWPIGAAESRRALEEMV